MSYSNIDQAVTFQPNQQLEHASSILMQHSLRRQEEERQQAKQEDERRYSLAGVIGKELDDNNFATGTAYDPLVSKEILKIREQISKQLLDKVSPAEIEINLQNSVSKFTNLQQRLKAVNANIAAQQKAYGKFPGIDPEAWGRLAKANAIYNTDPGTGQKTLKDPNDIDPNADYFAEVATLHPELIAKGDQPIRAFTATFKPVDMSRLPETLENKGVTITKEYKAHVPAYQELVTDANGWGTGIKVRSRAIPELSAPGEKPFEVVDDEVYRSYNSDPGTALYLNAGLKEYNKTAKVKIDQGSPESDIWKSHYLLGFLEKNGTGTFSPGYKETKNSQKDKLEMGIPLYRQGVTDAMKQLKADTKNAETDQATIARAMVGDPNALEGAKSIEIEGKNYYDITNTIGKFNLKIDKNGETIVADKMGIDPLTGTLMVQYKEDGKEQNVSYRGAEARRLMVRTAGINGSTAGKVQSSLDPYISKEGKAAKVYDNTPFIEAEAENDMAIQRMRKQAISKVDTFSKNGQVGELHDLVKSQLKDGSVIEDIQARGGALSLFMDPYFIQIKNGKKITFSNSQKLAEYLKSNIK